MVRSRINIVIFGDTHREVLKKLDESFFKYLELEPGLGNKVSDYADVELEISNADLEDGYAYRAVAYCKLKSK